MGAPLVVGGILDALGHGSRWIFGIFGLQIDRQSTADKDAQDKADRLGFDQGLHRPVGGWLAIRAKTNRRTDQQAAH